MTDPTEQLLRDTLVADAARAPAARGLADDAMARARGQRRTRWVVGGSVVVVTALVATGGIWSASRLGGDAIPLPGDVTAPTPSSTASPTEPALEYRGVFVPVPAQMLAPGAYRCGTAVRDAAYVDDPALPVEACAAFPHDDVTEVVLEPTGGRADDVPDGRSVLADGRTQVVVDVPDHHVRLRVLSPDPERAAALAGGIRVVDAPDGCALRAPDPTVPLALSEARARPPSGSTPTVVCGYRGGWLAESATLGEADAAGLAAALDTLPPFVDSVWSSPSGDPDDSAGSLWLVALDDGGTIRVYGGQASVVVDEQGRRALIGDELGGLLWGYAPGPASWSSGLAR